MKLVKSQKGFSLVEMIVAVSIFAITSVFIAELFVIAGKAQRRSGSTQKIQSDSRVMMAQISDRIRSSWINYDFYGGVVLSPETVLGLLDESGEEVIIRLSSTNFAQTVCPSAESTPCLEISEDGGLSYEPMTSEDFVMTSVQFYISPPKDPATSGGVDEQPRVTMVLGIQGIGANASGSPTYIQTTVSSRVYVR